MQAFLLIGNNSDELKRESEKLAKKFGAKIMEYPLSKIEDVRNLNNFVRLTLTEPTLIVSNDIHEVGTEALNAFLKNLEEPQDNLYFALTAPSIRKVLPTIVSRCEVIRIKNYEHLVGVESRVWDKNIEEFLSMNTQQRFAFFDKMKERDKAIEFVESLIFFLHERKEFTNMEMLLKTLTRLKANGNVNLHLTNLVINLN